MIDIRGNCEQAPGFGPSGSRTIWLPLRGSGVLAASDGHPLGRRALRGSICPPIALLWLQRRDVASTFPPKLSRTSRTRDQTIGLAATGTLQ